MRDRIAEIIAAIEPLDELEREHRDSTLEWIRSGAPIFRTAKPDVPPKHLVSYFALVDQQRGKLLLVDHKLAGLWLPSGGHVEPGEDPRATVVRELAEELNLAAEFVRRRPAVHHGDADGRSGRRAYRCVALVFAPRRQLARDRIRSRRVSWRAMVRLRRNSVRAVRPAYAPLRREDAQVTCRGGGPGLFRRRSAPTGGCSRRGR